MDELEKFERLVKLCKENGVSMAKVDGMEVSLAAESAPGATQYQIPTGAQLIESDPFAALDFDGPAIEDPLLWGGKSAPRLQRKEEEQ